MRFKDFSQMAVQNDIGVSETSISLDHGTKILGVVIAIIFYVWWSIL